MKISPLGLVCFTVHDPTRVRLAALTAVSLWAACPSRFSTSFDASGRR